MPLYEYGIVAGWNGTPVNVETISVSGAVGLDTVLSTLDTGTHYFVRGLGTHEVPEIATPNANTQNGYEIEIWTFPIISTVALAYLRDTYGQNSPQAGKVTVNTRLKNGTYVEKNAILKVPYPNVQAEFLRTNLYVFRDSVATARLSIVSDTA